jgi:threonine/homoserine/homoserine lactone efflux protein
MNKKLEEIRSKAIEAREKLSYANTGDQRTIARLDKIIRGAVLVKWMHRFAALFFIVFAAAFTYLTYPDARIMLLMLGIAAVGYAVCWIGIVVQMKIYAHTIGKARSALETR